MTPIHFSIFCNNMIPKRNMCLYRAVKSVIYYSDKRKPGSYNSLSPALPVYVVFFWSILSLGSAFAMKLKQK